MSYFEDLTRYIYHHGDGTGAVNIGWLDSGKPYPRGPVDDLTVRKLRRLCVEQFTRGMRGTHGCPFCQKPKRIAAKYGRNFCFLGSGEIRVYGAEKAYACPNMIIHYVEQHEYRPPDEFLEAVARSIPDKLMENEESVGWVTDMVRKVMGM